MSDGAMTVLVVEDEDAIRLTLREYLERKGHNVLVASDGVGAIKQLLDHAVDTIITDYRMDVLGGDYWMKFLERYCSGHRVIVVSGFLRPEAEIPFRVLYKPFEYADLEALLHEDGPIGAR